MAITSWFVCLLNETDGPGVLAGSENQRQLSTLRRPALIHRCFAVRRAMGPSLLTRSRVKGGSVPYCDVRQQNVSGKSQKEFDRALLRPSYNALPGLDEFDRFVSFVPSSA